MTKSSSARIERRQQKKIEPRTQTPAYISQELTYNSPLPPPQVMARYEQLCPGATERFITQLEKQSDHRQNLETIRVQGGIVSERIGQVTACVIFLAAIIVGGYLVSIGASGYGFAAIIAALVIPLALFILGRYGGAKDLMLKRAKLDQFDKDQARQDKS